jgi:hypothetical protein
MKKIAFALLTIALASPAIAGDKAKDNSAAPKKPHQICRRDMNATGTRMSPLVCKTAQEWEAYNEAGNGKLGTMAHGQQQGSGASPLASQP